MMKKVLLWIMIFALALGCLAGCKAPVEEESAAAGEYVETDTPDDTEQDVPTVIDPNEEPEVKEEEDTPGKDDGEEEETPSTTPGEDETPDEEEETPSITPDSGEETPDVEYKEGNKFSILDYNVRYTDDGPNKMISDRAPRLKKLVEQLEPDLMGFQEATPTWVGLMKEYFSGKYDYTYKERFPNDESAPIFWKKDKFTKVDDGYFWLSETPDEESKGWDGSHYRICSWVKLKVKATGDTFLYFNSHWDGTNTCHVNSAKLTLERARQLGAFNTLPMFLTGDFNMIINSSGYNTLTGTLELQDLNVALNYDRTSTVNGYNEGTSEDRIIDMCFYSYDLAVPVSYRVLNEKIDGGYISDHRGLFVEAAIL